MKNDKDKPKPETDKKPKEESLATAPCSAVGVLDMSTPGASELRKKMINSESKEDWDAVMDAVAKANQHSPLLGKQCNDLQDANRGQSHPSQPGCWESFLVVMRNDFRGPSDSLEGSQKNLGEGHNPKTDRCDEERRDIRGDSFQKQNA